MNVCVCVYSVLIRVLVAPDANELINTFCSGVLSLTKS